MSKPEYLGDGVYVRFDGYQIWLETLGDIEPKRIALEESVYENLVRYVDKLKAEQLEVVADGQRESQDTTQSDAGPSTAGPSHEETYEAVRSEDQSTTNIVQNDVTQIDSIPTINGIPVLLPPHDHPDFGDPGLHYHIDYRYCADKPVQGRVIFSDASPIYLDLPKVREIYQAEIESMFLLSYLSNKFDRLTACGKCPHLGLPIMGIGNGIRQCVGHGLTFTKDDNVVKEFWINIGGTRQFVLSGIKEYLFNFAKEGSARESIIETVCGTRVGSLSFKHEIVWLAGDSLCLTLS